jgi:hypothetical protein
MSGLAQASISPTTTPILDRLVPLPERRKRTRKALLLQIFLGAVIGGALSYTLISRPERFGAFSFLGTTNSLTPVISLWMFIFCFYASLYLGVIIHELGHLLAGILSGYRVNFIRVGPIQINPPFRVSRQPKSGIGAAGMVSLLPKKNSNVRASAVFMLLGGPLANLISAGFTFLLPKPVPAFASWFMGISVLLGIGNLIPFVRRGAVSDGYRILVTLRKTPRGERWLAIMHLCTALWDGELPEKLDQELLKRATAHVDLWPDTVAGHMLAYSAAFDQHNDAEAGRLLEIALQHSPFTFFVGKEAVLVEATIFQAKRRGRIDLAEQWLSDVPQETLTPGMRCLAEAAVLEARNDLAAALAKLKESEQAISMMPPGFERDVMLSSLTRRQSEIPVQRANAPVAG